jgi:glycosyltransferase involved in cell wall biosynthesis
MEKEKRFKIVYCTPALYLAGGMERVLTLKANYFAEHFDYDITIVITDGGGKKTFYALSEKVKVINLDINFEELWNQPFLKKVILYMKKQRQYKRKLTACLMQLHPDITISMLRREINFITSINDGSKKIGEIHINKTHFRTFEEHEKNVVKNIFSKYWMHTLIGNLKKLDRFVVLTENDKNLWYELDHVEVIPNPLSFTSTTYNNLTSKRIIAVGRYCHEKGYDHLLQAWASIQDQCPEWRLDVYGDGDRSTYHELLDRLGINSNRCALNPATPEIQKEFEGSSIAVCSSRFEGFGLVIIEAMACGIPVVSFDCPWGPRSIIQNDIDGLLVENGNVDKFAKAILRLVSNNDLRIKMGTNAKVNVQRFSIEAIANRWKALFEEVIKDK